MKRHSEVMLIYKKAFDTSEIWQERINIALADESKDVDTFEFNDDYTLFIIVYHIENAKPTKTRRQS